MQRPAERTIMQFYEYMKHEFPGIHSRIYVYGPIDGI